MKIYLDNCCYGRPFDDQAQDGIRAESYAVQNIVMLAQLYGHTIFGSTVLDAEIKSIEQGDAEKYADVLKFYQQTVTERAVLKECVLDLYEQLAINAGVRGPDVFHLCLAISAGADYLVTTDKRFIRAAAKMTLPITVINPVKFPLGGTI